MISGNDNYAELLKRREINFLLYNLLKRCILKPLANRYFDIHIQGKERIPDRSCIIATHHCLSFDWVMMAVILKRKPHGWIDKEIAGKVKFLGSLAEIISVNTSGKLDSRNDYRITKDVSRIWLEKTNELVVTVTDGPSKHSLRQDGSITKLAERLNRSGAASVAIETKAPVVPFSSWIPGEYERELFSWKGTARTLKYLERYRKIPYFCEFLEPVSTFDFPTRRELRREIRKRQLAGYQRLEARGRAYMKNQGVAKK